MEANLADHAVDALQDRLKFIEDELLRSQPDYSSGKQKRRTPSCKLVVKTKAQVEEEMRLNRQKALFGSMPPKKPPSPPLEEKPCPRPPRKTKKYAERMADKAAKEAVAKPGGFLADLYARAAAAAEAERPKEDPNALPLAPHFYNVAEEQKFDKNILDFKTEASKEEYESLVKTYGEYLGGEEEDLWDLWMRLGGNSTWRKHLRPTQLTLLLSREPTMKVRFRVEPEKLKYLEGFNIEGREAGSFFSNVLPRLPKLEYLEIMDCPVQPFHMSVLQQLSNPFPALKGLYAIFVNWTAEDVMSLLKYCKNIERGKMRIDPKTVAFTKDITEKNILERSQGKVSFITTH